MRRIFAALLILIAPDVVAWNLPDTYSAGPTWGKVVDADTQQPIRGALVVALWDLQGGLERGRFDTFKVAEALTDEGGDFRMDGWGPLPRPDNGLLDKYDPHIIVFKSGYTPASLLNDKFAPPYARVELTVRDSVYNGKVTSLRKYQGPEKNYALIVGNISGMLSMLHRGTNCRWKEIPKTLRVLEEEGRRETKQGVTPMIGVTVDRLLQQRQCEPTDQFLKAYRGTD